MANTYYYSTLTEEQIEEALAAIHDVIQVQNNNKVLAISGGKIVARSVQWGHDPVMIDKTGTVNNTTYYPANDNADAYRSFTTAVPTLPSAVGVSF